MYAAVNIAVAILLYHFTLFLFLSFLLSSLFLSPFLMVSMWSANFTVMSYNILCDKYATRNVYGYCPSWALSWDYRKRNLLKEMLDNMADIMGLQVKQ